MVLSVTVCLYFRRSLWPPRSSSSRHYRRRERRRRREREEEDEEEEHKSVQVTQAGPRGFWGYVEMAGVDAQMCIRWLHGSKVRGQILKVKEVGMSCY